MEARKWFDLNGIDPEAEFTFEIATRGAGEKRFKKLLMEMLTDAVCEQSKRYDGMGPMPGLQFADPEPERKPLEDGPDLPFWDDGDDEELDDFARDEVWRD